MAGRKIPVIPEQRSKKLCIATLTQSPAKRSSNLKGTCNSILRKSYSKNVSPLKTIHERKKKAQGTQTNFVDHDVEQLSSGFHFSVNVQSFSILLLLRLHTLSFATQKLKISIFNITDYYVDCQLVIYNICCLSYSSRTTYMRSWLF